MRFINAPVGQELLRNVEAMIQNEENLPKDIFRPRNSAHPRLNGEPPDLCSDQSELHLDRLTPVERSRLQTILTILTA
jgi:hypothetical protein